MFCHHLDVLTSKVRNLTCEQTCIIDRAWRHFVRIQNPIRDSDPVVILAERGCLVDDAGAILCSDIGVVDNAECPIFVLVKQCKMSPVQIATGRENTPAL